MHRPGISVIMPVFNTGDYVGEAIRSILDQTFRDFELIIIEDGSTDSSLAIIKSFNDPRIKLITHTCNKGNYPSRNEGISIARGKYICVMDSDDVSLLNRLERQYNFMEDNPEIGLAGSGFRYLGEQQDIYREPDYERIRILLLRNNCFLHPTLVLRHNLLIKHNLYYDEKYYYSADYDLAVRSSKLFPVTNITEILLLYRLHKNQITFSHRAKQAEYAEEILLGQLRSIGLDPDPIEIRMHLNLTKGIPVSFKDASTLYKWTTKLKASCINHYDSNLLNSLVDSLLLRQSFITKIESPGIQIPPLEAKYDISDCEILIPVRIDSYLRLENTFTVINLIRQYLNIQIRVLESDSTSSLSPVSDLENVIFHFEVDNNTVYNKTKWVNKLISFSESEYLVVWDTDVIVRIDQIIESINSVKSGKYSMSLPYDGRVFSVNSEMSKLFRNYLKTDVLEKIQPFCELMHGYHMAGGIYVVKKEFFNRHGAENECISGWGLEDAERLKRMETSGLPVHRSSGALFHLYHPRGENSRFADNETEKGNRIEFIRTCELCQSEK